MTKKILCKECCKGFLIEKKGKHGFFYGCTNFPECKHTESWIRNNDIRVDTWWMNKFLFDLYCIEEKIDESKEQSENHIIEFNLFLCELLRDLVNKKKFVSEIVQKIIEKEGDSYEHTQ
tara:strand:+ start:265 stop:621 length:357 start_codon:yes stop_codon:yes gene_type:complete